METDDIIHAFFKENNEKSEKMFVEVELESGLISWVNESTKSMCLKNQHLVGSSVYGIVHDTHRGRLSSLISRIRTKKSSIIKRTLWPVNFDDKILWLMTVIKASDDKFIIFSISHIIMTDISSIEFEFANLSSENIYLSSLALSEILDIKNAEVKCQKSVGCEITSIKSNILDSINASEKAEKVAKESQSILEALNDEVKDQFDRHTQDIIRLMTSDENHNRRMNEFDDKVKKTTKEALTQIVNQADNSGRGLTKKVTIPVGFMAAMIAFIQWLITHYFK